MLIRFSCNLGKKFVVSVCRYNILLGKCIIFISSTYIADMIDNTNFQHDLDIKVETYHLDQCEEILGLVNDATSISGNETYTADGMLFQCISFQKIILHNKMIWLLIFHP